MVIEHELHLVYPAKVCVIIGEGNCNPLQYSCLENPMDRWVWQATVHGVTKSRTQLNDLTCVIRALPETYRSAAMRVRMLSSFSCVWLFATPWTVVCQAPRSMGFSLQEYCSELPCPLPGGLNDSRIKSMSPALQVDSFPLSHQGSPFSSYAYSSNSVFSRMLNKKRSFEKMSPSP